MATSTKVFCTSQMYPSKLVTKTRNSNSTQWASQDEVGGIYEAGWSGLELNCMAGIEPEGAGKNGAEIKLEDPGKDEAEFKLEEADRDGAGIKPEEAGRVGLQIESEEGVDSLDWHNPAAEYI